MTNKRQTSTISHAAGLNLAGAVGLTFGLLTVVFGMAGCDSKPVDSSATSSSVGTVKLLIDFGKRRQNISVDVPCSVDSTVYQILERARNIADLEFYKSGAGETTFVRSIDGIENEGANGDNWIFRVNGKLGDKSSGIFPVQPGDRVEWSLGDYP